MYMKCVVVDNVGYCYTYIYIHTYIYIYMYKVSAFQEHTFNSLHVYQLQF